MEVQTSRDWKVVGLVKVLGGLDERRVSLVSVGDENVV